MSFLQAKKTQNFENYFKKTNKTYLIYSFFFVRIVFVNICICTKEFAFFVRGDDREAEGNALLMRRMATPYRGFESLSLRKKNKKILTFNSANLGLVGIEPTTPCVGNTDSKSTELQA